MFIDCFTSKKVGGRQLGSARLLPTIRYIYTFRKIHNSTFIMKTRRQKYIVVNSTTTDDITILKIIYSYTILGSMYAV